MKERMILSAIILKICCDQLLLLPDHVGTISGRVNIVWYRKTTNNPKGHVTLDMIGRPRCTTIKYSHKQRGKKDLVLPFWKDIG